MICDEPSACKDHHSDLPPLEADEIKVQSFDSPIDMAQEDHAPRKLAVPVHVTTKQHTSTFIATLPVVSANLA